MRGAVVGPAAGAIAGFFVGAAGFTGRLRAGVVFVGMEASKWLND
jgi:hypothetical protein